jgi:hypothetical protein
MTYPNGGDELSRASDQGQTDQEYRLRVRLNVNQVIDAMLRDAILKAKHEQVIKLRKAGLSYAVIGRRLGLSRERVRQIDKQISVPKKPGPEFDVMLESREVARMLSVHKDSSDETLITSLLKGLR